MIAVIPSHRRAGRVVTRKWLPEAILAVPEHEQDEYREKEGGEVVAYPSSLCGNIAAIRNWIFERFYPEDRYLLMVDDDVRCLQRLSPRGQFDLTPEEARHYLVQGFELAEDFGARYWGMQVLNDPLAYRIDEPFSLVRPVLAVVCGHICNPLRYDERMPLKEDYDFYLQHLQRYKVVLRINFLAYDCEHLDNLGGLTPYRSSAAEREQAELLMRKWGRRIVKLRKDSVNPRINPPRKGV
jgi:hypothetical protein